MKIKFFWKPVLWLAIICYGLFLPANNLPSKPFLNIPYLDKIVHFGLFFVLCLLLFRPFKKLKLKHFYYAPLLAIALGALLESVQRQVSSSRSSDIYDFIANSLGIIVATLFFYLFVSNKKWEKLF